METPKFGPTRPTVFVDMELLAVAFKFYISSFINEMILICDV